jgi:hypothetical protein
MHFHLPKPLHGWREFVGEVGIIVIGVPIALAAEQVVEASYVETQERKSASAFIKLLVATDYIRQRTNGDMSSSHRCSIGPMRRC